MYLEGGKEEGRDKTNAAGDSHFLLVVLHIEVLHVISHGHIIFGFMSGKRIIVSKVGFHRYWYQKVAKC